MSKRYYVLDTEQESDTCRQQAYDAHISIPANAAYKNITTGWSHTQTRVTDGKYIVPYCEHLGESSYIVETSDPSWFDHDRPFGL